VRSVILARPLPSRPAVVRRICVKPHIHLALCLLAAAAAPALAQPAPAAAPASWHVTRAASAVKVDAVLDEPAWKAATRIPVDNEWLPGDNVPAPVKTDAFITYDDTNLYIAFHAYDPNPSQIRAHLMDRDSIDTFVQDDHVSVLIDTFDDERRAYQFRVNPLGVQADAIFSEVDGIEDFSWDAIWKSAGRITSDGYIVEMAIPLNQIRFPSSAATMTWGFELGRSYPRTVRHRISANRRDRNRACILCQISKVSGFANLKPGRNVEVDPTVTAHRTDTRPDFPSGPIGKDSQDAQLGATLRWGVTPNVTVNATANPDFSQVEADVAQLAANERFALFYPEKRPFFLEGIDVFSTPIEAVFTRTVVNPSWGAKATTKSGRNLAGVFVTRDAVNSLILPSNQSSSTASLDENVTGSVLRYRRDVGAGSTLGVLYAGREAGDYHNRVGGADGFFRLSATDSVKFQYLRSDTQYPDAIVHGLGQRADAFPGNALDAQYDHIARSWYWSGWYSDYDRGFRADSGFVPQVDVRTAAADTGYQFWGGPDDWYTQAAIGGGFTRSYDHEGHLTGENVSVNASMSWALQSNLLVIYQRSKVYFGETLYRGLDIVAASFQQQPSGLVSFGVTVRAGDSVDYANGRPATLFQIAPSVELKPGRHLNAQLNYTVRVLDAEGGRVFRADLAQLRLVHQFSVRAFVRAILQYQTMASNVAAYTAPVEPRTRALFSQFLYSYKLNPQTVLFLGYSDNRLGEQGIALTQTDRTFFLKIGYAWLM
jgi:hypothetical protein